MYDPAAKVKKYLHCEIGQSDIQTRMRKSILSIEVDMDPEQIRMAMQQGAKEGCESKARA